MKKLLLTVFLFLITILQSEASNIKFVQIDSLKYSPYSQEKIDTFDSAINEINKQKDISFVIFTGNNIAKSDKKYLKSFLKAANNLHSPYYIALGHKDLNKKKGISKSEYVKLAHKHIKKPNYVFSQKGVAFIVADGAKEFIPTPFGYYREDVINFLDKALTKNAAKNVVIIQHFPIYPPSESESYQTYKAEDYMKMLEKHSNVKAIISGFGINSEKEYKGIKHITTAEFPKYRIIEIIDCKSSDPTIWSTLK